MSGYGSSDYVGLFMDFNLYKITELNEEKIVITYIANECAGEHQYVSDNLEEIIFKIIRHEYLNNFFYECLLSEYVNDIRKERRGR